MDKLKRQGKVLGKHIDAISKGKNIGKKLKRASDKSYKQVVKAKAQEKNPGTIGKITAKNRLKLEKNKKRNNAK